MSSDKPFHMKSHMKILGELSACLNRGSPAGSQASSEASRSGALGEALGLIGRTVNARRIDLVKRTESDDNGFSLHRVCSWSAEPDDGVEENLKEAPFDPESLNPDQWLELESDQSIRTDPASGQGDGDGPDASVMPLFSDGALFGCLTVVRNAPDGPDAQPDEDFLFAACRIIELWITIADSRKRFDDLVDVMPTPTFLIDREGVVRGWSRATAELTGRKSHDIIGKGNYEHALPFYGHRRPCVADLIQHPRPGMGSHLPGIQ